MVVVLFRPLAAVCLRSLCILLQLLMMLFISRIHRSLLTDISEIDQETSTFNIQTLQNSTALPDTHDPLKNEETVYQLNRGNIFSGDIF